MDMRCGPVRPESPNRRGVSRSFSQNRRGASRCPRNRCFAIRSDTANPEPFRLPLVPSREHTSAPSHTPLGDRFSCNPPAPPPPPFLQPPTHPIPRLSPRSDRIGPVSAAALHCCAVFDGPLRPTSGLGSGRLRHPFKFEIDYHKPGK